MPDRFHALRTSLTHRAAAAFVAVAVTAAALACSADAPVQPDPSVRPTDALHFLRPAPDAPALVSSQVSFWARRGEDREVFLYYQPRPGQSSGDEFMRFRVPGASLERRPDGTAFQQGDSVLITVTVSDPARLLLDFQPSGLRFSPSAPARLKIRFADANDDFDGDGDVDANDSAVEQQFAIWKQEAPGLPWFRMTSTLKVDTEDVEADLLGFTGYAIAF